MPKVVMLTTLAPTTAQRLVEVARPVMRSRFTRQSCRSRRSRTVADADFRSCSRLAWTTPCWPGPAQLKLISWSARASTRSTSTCAAAWGFRSPTTAGPTLDVAEHTLTLLLAFYRRLREMDANVRQGRWAIDSGATTYTVRARRRLLGIA